MNINVTFVRTPENAQPGIRENSDMAYIAHSVMSIRHAPNGMTFDEIYADHVGQAETDASVPFDETDAAFHLIRCIEHGLVSTLTTRTTRAA